MMLLVVSLAAADANEESAESLRSLPGVSCRAFDGDEQGCRSSRIRGVRECQFSDGKFLLAPHVHAPESHTSTSALREWLRTHGGLTDDALSRVMPALREKWVYSRPELVRLWATKHREFRQLFEGEAERVQVAVRSPRVLEAVIGHPALATPAAVRYVPPVPERAYGVVFDQIERVFTTFLNATESRRSWYQLALKLTGGPISGGIAGEPLQRDFYFHTAANPRVKTVCEVGFNVGHSSSIWMLANPAASVLNFDKQYYVRRRRRERLGCGAHHHHLEPNRSTASPRCATWQDFGRPTRRLVEGLFPGRFQMVVGDSGETIPKFIRKRRKQSRPLPACDLVHVDGMHTYAYAFKDTVNLMPMMSCDTLIMMDDACDPYRCHCHSPRESSFKARFGMCVGPTQAWHQLREQGVIRQEDTFFDARNPTRGWVVGHLACTNGTKPNAPSLRALPKPVQVQYSRAPQRSS